MSFMIFSFLFIFFGFIARNIRLYAVPFQDWDEAIYAQVAQEILKNESLITTFNGQLWLNKPPLVHTLIATVFKVFGPSEFWSSMIMVAFACILIFLTFLLTRRLLTTLFLEPLKKLTYIERQIALLLPAFGLSTSLLFLDRTTILNTDTLLAVAWVGYFLFRDSYWGKLGFITLGVWTKSLLGFYPLLFEIFFIRRTDLTLKNFFKGLFLLTIASSWYIWAYLTYKDFFIKAHLYDQVLKRVLYPIELHFGSIFSYPLTLWDNVEGLAVFLLIGIAMLIIHGFKKEWHKKLLTDFQKKWTYVVLLVPYPFFLFLVFARSKIPWYVMPTLPFIFLPLSIFFLTVKDRLLRWLCVGFIFMYFLIRFTLQTYLVKPDATIRHTVNIGKCIAKYEIGDSEKVAFLVDGQERQNRNVVEAARLNTETSFLYGGSPSFVFYSGKFVKFFYDVSEFTSTYRSYPIIVISDSDRHGAGLETDEILINEYKQICRDGGWNAYLRL